jgi:hypothetical protein
MGVRANPLHLPGLSSLNTSRKPLSPTHYTGAETGLPSHLNVVTLT